MEILQDILAALSVILNGLPQGLLALSYGFASIPTALAFIVGAAGNALVGSVAPVSFQAETITVAGTMGQDRCERLSMTFLGGCIMTLIGLFGLLERIVDFVGPVITSGMMAGVGIMLAKVSIDMARKNHIVGFSSMIVGFITYLLTKNLVYTITVSVVVSSAISLMLKKKSDIQVTEKEGFVLQKFKINPTVVRGAMAMVCLNIGANIAFGKITGQIAKTDVNVDHLSVISSLADMVSSIFGGGPVESIISATGSAPHPVWSGGTHDGFDGRYTVGGIVTQDREIHPERVHCGVPVRAGRNSHRTHKRCKCFGGWRDTRRAHRGRGNHDGYRHHRSLPGNAGRPCTQAARVHNRAVNTIRMKAGKEVFSWHKKLTRFTWLASQGNCQL